MAARVGYLQHIVLGRLFGSQNFECDPMALWVKFPARAFGQGKLGINLLALVCGQPAGSVQCTVGLFPAGQSQFNRTLRLITFFPETNQIVDPNRDLGLHVVCPTAVEVSILFDQDEGVTSPVLALSLDYVNMTEQQDCLGGGV